MINQLLGLYKPSYTTILVYMLQSTEYSVKPYLAWWWRTSEFDEVMKRRELDRTRSAMLLLIVVRLGILAEIFFGFALFYEGFFNGMTGGIAFGLALIIGYPVLWPHLIALPLILGRIFISGPAEQRLIIESSSIFSKHPGIKIAVAGSYGKTTMKEILIAVLSQGLRVAATPANKNVSISHARFAKKLSGKEEVLIIEYGEGAPGDVARFANITRPTHAVITGLAPAHLDKYKTLEAAGEDIFSVADYVDHNQVFVSNETPAIKQFIEPGFKLFNNKQALGWLVESAKFDISGTKFRLKKNHKQIELSSSLLGKHHLGFLTFAAALGLELGLSVEQVQTGIQQTKPFEHRMQPYSLGGAWVIDDTYNGNIEGIRAGLELLKTLPAKRKIYITPGLVEQGEQSKNVHTEIGKLIADTNPDLVILMDNSTTEYIIAGLKTAKYAGESRIETNPLEFYTNLKHIVAEGDLVLMQNDWTDNYA
ncbi:MAG: hypothetical protein NVS1B10_03510 [Candidatus Saccharimonadales bacterium]